MKVKLLILFFIGWTLPVWAGSEIQVHLENESAKDAWVDLDAFVWNGHVRVNFTGPYTHGALIYDKKTSVITLVDDLNKQVWPVNQTTQMGLKMMGFVAMTAIKSQVSGGASSIKLAYSLVEKNAQALFNGEARLKKKHTYMDGFGSEFYQTDLNGRKIREVWMTPLSSTAISVDDNDTLWGFAKKMTDLLGSELSQLGADPTVFNQSQPGSQWPIHMALYAEGKISCRFKTNYIRDRKFFPGAFDPPANYQEMDLLELVKQGIK